MKEIEIEFTTSLIVFCSHSRGRRKRRQQIPTSNSFNVQSRELNIDFAENAESLTTKVAAGERSFISKARSMGLWRAAKADSGVGQYRFILDAIDSVINFSFSRQAMNLASTEKAARAKSDREAPK